MMCIGANVTRVQYRIVFKVLCVRRAYAEEGKFVGADFTNAVADR